MKVEDWSLVMGSWNLAGVLTRRYTCQSCVRIWCGRMILRVCSDLMDPEVEQFKSADKKPTSPTIDVNVRPMNILDIDIVVNKTRVNNNQGDLKYEWRGFGCYNSLLFREVSLGGLLLWREARWITSSTLKLTRRINRLVIL